MMKMKAYLPIILVLLYTACEVINPEEEVAAFIRIDEVNTTEVGTANITDLWFYFENELQGTYPIPSVFPVLRHGEQDIYIAAGIKKNGIASSRDKYPFYRWHNENITLSPGDTTLISPRISYNTDIVFIEDFNNQSIGHQFDTTSTSTMKPEFIYTNNNGYLYANLNQEGDKMSIIGPTITLPLLSEIYVELDYKCNANFLVGLMCYYPQYAIPKVTNVIAPKEDWNKIYLDLDDFVTSEITNGAFSFSVWIAMDQDTTLENSELYLDNIKLLHEE